MKEKSFGKQLEYYIRESGYTNYEFARVSGINRVNIQRYLAGTRLPNAETFEEMMKKLRMGVWEQRELFESYKRAMDGDNVYFLRKNIHDMLEKAGDICGVENSHPEWTKDGECGDTLQIISGEIAVKRYMWAAIGAMTKKQDGKAPSVCFYIPAENCPLSEFLPTFYRDGKSVLDGLRIIQLVPLTKRSEVLQHQYHNLKVLYHLIAAYYQTGSGYETCFYYDDYQAGGGRNGGEMYPYYGILADRVVLFSENMEQAIVAADDRVAELYRQQFMRRLQGRGMSKLVTFFDNAVEMLRWFLQNDNGAEKRLFLEYQPCVAAWTDREMLEDALEADIPGREYVIEGMMKRKEQLDSGGELIHYFAEEGLREFAETGVCVDYPKEYVRPLTKKERRLILDRMLAEAETGKKELGIIDGKCLHLTRMLNVFVSSVCGAGFVLYDEKQGFRQLMVQEPSICQAFGLYIEGMKEHREVYSREKTIEILRKYRDLLDVD